MTSAEIRDSFFSFFHDKGHTIVPSASLMPTSPNLLFTNAGMNQFIPLLPRHPEFSLQSPARRRYPEMHPRRRKTQRSRRRRPRHLSPHFLRDAGKLVLRRLLQGGGHQVGRGNSLVETLGFSARSASTPRFTNPAEGDPSVSLTRMLTITGRRSSSKAGLDPSGAHRRRQRQR